MWRLTLYDYADAQRGIHALKFGGDAWRGLVLGRWMAQSLGDWLCELGVSPTLAVVPIPLHRRRLRARGYNQCERLGRSFARSLRLTFRATLLRRTVFNQEQARADEAQRRARENPFRARPGTRDVLLIDDVLTTGTTLKHAAEALFLAGHRPCGMIALARSPRADGTRPLAGESGPLRDKPRAHASAAPRRGGQPALRPA